jgi:ATP-dependent helicase HepA
MGPAMERAPLEPCAESVIETALASARAARDRLRAAVYRSPDGEPFRRELAARILVRVPPGLDALNEDVVTVACERLGLTAERKSGPRTWSIELGNEALVDHLPGVAGGTSFLGTFDRDTAVADESLDFFAAGHPLVEGVLAYLDDDALGRVALLRVRGDRALGLLALYRDAGGVEAVAVDEAGRRRAEWVSALAQRPIRVRHGGAEEAGRPGWADRIRGLAAHLDAGREPVALAAVISEP